jgi:hypothetical protein
MVTPTPPFVRWTLARACALREETDPRDPEAAERQLRPLRAYTDASYAGRVFEGICLAPTEHLPVEPPPDSWGFLASEMLAAYGGEEFVRSQCGACVANIFAHRTEVNFAGCYGLLACDAALGAQLEARIAELSLADAIDASCLPTAPRWYGLFAQTPLNRDQLAIFQQLFSSLATCEPAVSQLCSAVAIALVQPVELHLALYPAGEFDRDAWRIVSHCTRCAAAMSPREHRCAVCGLVGKPRPARQRKPRGRRPYVPLARFLGASKALEFAERLKMQRQEGDRNT